MLSGYCSDIANKYETKVGGVNKLVPNLRNKDKYVVHYRNLQLYLFLGIKLSKVHRVLKFKRFNWLEEYIKFNTEKRKQSNSAYHKFFLKKADQFCVWKNNRKFKKKSSCQID